MEKTVESEHAARHKPRSDAESLLARLRERNRAAREVAAGVRAASKDRARIGGSGDERADRALREVCEQRKLVC